MSLSTNNNDHNYINNHTHTDACSQMLHGNANWAAQVTDKNPSYFDELAKGQSPQVLWIGCADSRVPENRITNTQPGEVFVHRNIANVVVNTDMNMLSVLEYAINVLKVKHVVVTGHYGCGGVAAAMARKQVGMIDNWLRNIKDVYRLHSQELGAITDEKQKFNRLVELNVQEQVYNVCKTTIVQNAWAAGANLQVHGWVFDLSTGLLKDLGFTRSSAGDLGHVYDFEEAANQMAATH